MSNPDALRPSSPVTDDLHLLTPDQRGLLWVVGGISIFTNLLMLTGPIFMLQIYDRVLSSRSEATLVVLLVLVGFLYLIFGLLDHARGRIAARLGAQVQDTLDQPVFAAALRAGGGRSGDPVAARAPQDLSMLQQLSGTPVFMALFDFPWVPLFIGVIALLHPWLGALALASALVLAGLGITNITGNRDRIGASQLASQRSDIMARQIAQEAAQMRALGMQADALARWHGLRRGALEKILRANDGTGRFGASARALRLFLQSAMLAAGALLVLQAQLSAGAMIAASIILGRALAPLDQLIGGWPQIQAARSALGRLRQVLRTAPPDAARTHLPQPRGQLSVRGLALRVPGSSGTEGIVLRDISFELQPGQALGIIGPSGAGKSSLAEALVGIWPPSLGEIRLDSARLDQYPPGQLGRAIGYLPQRVTLFEGSLRDNIARLDPDAQDADVVAAAQVAGAHDVILALPQGYDTMITADGGWLSGGQVQRIALARALYGNPALVVLDEPNANLDDPGSRALNLAIRAAKARGASVLIMAHRPSAIAECDLLMKLERGRATAFGPVDEVLRKVTRNSADLLRDRPQGPQEPAATLAFPWDSRASEGKP